MTSAKNDFLIMTSVKVNYDKIKNMIEPQSTLEDIWTAEDLDDMLCVKKKQKKQKKESGSNAGAMPTHSESNTDGMPNDASSSSTSSSPSDIYTDDFKEFWRTCWVKQGKDKSFEAFLKAK